MIIKSLVLFFKNILCQKIACQIFINQIGYRRGALVGVVHAVVIVIGVWFEGVAKIKKMAMSCFSDLDRGAVVHVHDFPSVGGFLGIERLGDQERNGAILETLVN